MRHFVTLALGCALLSMGAGACGNGGSTSGTGTGGTGGGSNSMCPTNGVVPPDLRDVERAGEGLVNTTFGKAPARTPDWANASSVFSILTTVWGRTKTQCPKLPAGDAKKIDDAIAKLGPALTAKDQKTAVLASNTIGLAVPSLFASFNPAVLEVIRMDAVFRQVGIDAHFGDWAGSTADLASMKADWTVLKPKVAVRAPKCHRVGGTATVSSDIDASLANLSTSVPAKSGVMTEAESDNGALEIDTLELLFDCPPDGPAPAHGIGSTCATTADCSAAQACDPANKKCAPDPSTAKIGTPCMTTIDCGSDPRAACLNASGDGWPGGYCGMEPCDDVQVCPPGATCLSEPHERPGCHASCTKDADCRTADGYICQLYLTNPPNGFGPSTGGCGFKCTDDSGCNDDGTTKLTCDVATGHCKP